MNSREATNEPLPSLSVIIPTLDRGPYLCKTIEQLLTQDSPPQEIIVVDQSANHPAEVAAQLERWRETRVIRYFHHSFASAARARNRGILESRNEILLFLDDDVLIDPGFLVAHLRNYRDPEIVSVSGSFSGEGGKDFTPINVVPPEADQQPYGWMEVPANLSRRFPKFPIHAGNCSVRRWAALANGGFDESFGRLDLASDSDFGWRLGQSGFGQMWHDPACRLYHIRAPRGGCRRLEPRWHLPDTEEVIGRLYLHAKNFSLWTGRRFVWNLFRSRVLNKGNLFRPWWMPLALLRFFTGMWIAVKRAAEPAHDLTFTHPELVEETRQTRNIPSRPAAGTRISATQCDPFVIP